ncbi:MAG: hypothetical protein KKA60_00520 [Proteobacteria bacterium]|nr:hypothetical protein [Pseudomonadota bacterium]
MSEVTVKIGSKLDKAEAKKTDRNQAAMLRPTPGGQGDVAGQSAKQVLAMCPYCGYVGYIWGDTESPTRIICSMCVEIFAAPPA